MDITQLLATVSVLAGIALMTVLAVVPLWLRHDAEKAEIAAARTPRAPQPPLATVRHLPRRATAGPQHQAA